MRPTSRVRRAVGLGAAAVVTFPLWRSAAVGGDGQGSLARAATEDAWKYDPERLAALDELRQQMQGGWVPFHGDPGAPGVEVPDDLWIVWDETSFERVAFERPERRAAVHQGKGGPVVGYYYEDVGYIPAEMAGTFDPGPVRAAREACDAAVDPGC